MTIKCVFRKLVRKDFKLLCETAIEQLAIQLMNPSNLTLSKNEIEQSLTAPGFFHFIEEYINYNYRFALPKPVV